MQCGTEFSVTTELLNIRLSGSKESRRGPRG